MNNVENNNQAPQNTTFYPDLSNEINHIEIRNPLPSAPPNTNIPLSRSTPNSYAATAPPQPSENEELNNENHQDENVDNDDGIVMGFRNPNISPSN